MTALELICFASAAAADALATARPLAVHVRNNLLIDQDGNPVRLLGVNRSGTEYTCLTGSGIFDGPVDAAAIAAIAAWHTNAVRVPLNEDCWLGINLGSGNPGVGKPYRSAIAGFVARLNRAGLYPILELHWNAPGKDVADRQQPMADLDHAPAFWAAVAAAFKNNPAVIFDLYNEPYINSWRCWRDGCTVTTASGSWKTAGMRALVDAVRAAGATEPIMLGGLEWGSDLSRWLGFVPSDPLRRRHDNPVPGSAQIIAAYHTYCGSSGANKVAACRAALPATEAQWPAVLQVSRQAPVVTGEFGEYDCATTYADPYMRFADRHGISYLGWAWDTYGCGQFPALISNYNGTPTRYGAGLMQHLAALFQ